MLWQVSAISETLFKHFFKIKPNFARHPAGCIYNEPSRQTRQIRKMLVLSVCRNNHWELFVCVTNPFHIFKLLWVLYSGHYNSLLCVVLSMVDAFQTYLCQNWGTLDISGCSWSCSGAPAAWSPPRSWRQHDTGTSSRWAEAGTGLARAGQQSKWQSKKRKGCLRSEDCMLPHCSPPISRCQLRHPGDPARPGAWWPAATV